MADSIEQRRIATWKEFLDCEAEWSRRAPDPLFRNWLPELMASATTRGLWAQVSHRKLNISPHEKFPEWVRGALVEVRSTRTGRVIFELYGPRPEPKVSKFVGGAPITFPDPVATRECSVDEGLAVIAPLLDRLRGAWNLEA